MLSMFFGFPNAKKNNISSIKIKRNNIYESNVDSISWDLYCQYIYEQYGEGNNATYYNEYTVFQIPHPKICGSVYGIENRSSKTIRVTLDFSRNIGCYFSPWNGIVTKVVGPESVKYLCSCVENTNIPIEERRKTFEYYTKIEEVKNAEVV